MDPHDKSQQTLRPLRHRPVGIDVYEIAESLALFMGFLEPDPTRAGQTRIPTHNTLWADTGDNTRAKFTVFKVDIAQNPDAWPLRGVRFYLDVHPSRINYMMNRRVTDMGAWEQNTPLTTLLPYVIQAFPAVVVSGFGTRSMVAASAVGWLHAL